MKKILQISILALLAVFWAVIVSHAACVGPTFSTVQTAVTNAARGSTVEVCAGNATWSSSLTITKAITLQGAGAGVTTITANTAANNHIIQYLPSDVAADANYLLHIKGFTFDADDAFPIIQLRHTGTTYVKARISNNEFKNLIECKTCDGGDWDYHVILARGLYYGVIDNNTFSGAPYIVLVGTKIDGSSYGAWNFNNETFQYGDSKGWFIEDNSFTVPDGATSFSNIGAGWGARQIIRYNTFTNLITDDNGIAAVEGHNAWGGIFPSGLTEMYGNYFSESTTETYFWRLFLLARGGKNLGFWNRSSISGTAYRILKADLENFSKPANCGTRTNYTCPSGTLTSGAYCTSDGMPQEVNNTYLFNNRYGATGTTEAKYTAYTRSGVNCCATSTCTQPEIDAGKSNSNCDDCHAYGTGYSTPALRANTDYWLPSLSTPCNSSGTCLTGIGCGSNTPTGTCTAGTAYWKTNQSCSTVSTSIIGAATPIGARTLSSEISGSLYRCETVPGTTRTTWKPYYKPYAYPHPLTITSIVNANGVTPATHTAADCERETIQGLIDFAYTGDTINVPAGACNWDKYLHIKKAIKLIGAGSGTPNYDAMTYTCNPLENTCITITHTADEGSACDPNPYTGAPSTAFCGRERPSQYAFWIYTGDDYVNSYNKEIRVSGFSFDLNNRASGMLVNNYSDTYPLTKLQIDNNLFFGLPPTALGLGKIVSFMFGGHVWGVVHNNVWWSGSFYNIVNGRGDSSWDFTGIYPGSSKILTFEDNYFRESVVGTDQAGCGVPGIAISHGGSAAIRYNTWVKDYACYIPASGKPAQRRTEPFQNHGNNGIGGSFSGIVMELYGNRLYDTYNESYRMVNHRGGRNLTFFNQLYTTATSNSAFAGPYMQYIECEECVDLPDPNAWRHGRGGDIANPTGNVCPTGDNRLYPTGSQYETGTCLGATPPWYNCIDGQCTLSPCAAKSSTCYIAGTTSNCYSCGAAPISQPQHVWKNYSWNNRDGAGGTGNHKWQQLYQASSGTPEKKIYENQHYWVDKHGAPTFDGSVQASVIYDPKSVGKNGIGCGTYAQRNAIATCTKGTAFWVTDVKDDGVSAQTCDQVSSASSGRNPSAPLSGYLSTCKETNTWSAGPYAVGGSADIAAGHTYVPLPYPHPLRQDTRDDDPPVPYTKSTPTGKQPCTGESANVTVSFQVSDTSTVTCRSCKEGTEGCDGDSTYDDMVDMLGETVYSLSSRSGNVHTMTATITSSCNSAQKHWARCTDANGYDMTNSIGITYTMDTTDDSADPELDSATVEADGVTITLKFDEDVQFGTGGNTGWSLTRRRDGVDSVLALTYLSGDGSSTLVYTVDATSTILATDDITITYTQPGDGVVDKGGGSSSYADSCPDAGNDGNMMAEVPNGEAGGLCNWTIQNQVRWPTGAGEGLVSFTEPCNSVGGTVDASHPTSYYTNSDHWLNAYYAKVAGQSFESTGGTLHSAKFYLNKKGNPNGNVVAKLYSHSGSYGTTSTTDSLLATSDEVAASTITSSSNKQLVTFTFTGGEKYTLVDGTKYVITVEYLGTSGGVGADCPARYADGSANMIYVGASNVPANHAGNAVTDYIDDPPWCGQITTYAKAGEDVLFYVYKDADASLGCTDISEDNCIRITKDQCEKYEDVMAFKKLWDTDSPEDVYLQFYFKNMSQPKDVDCDMTDDDPETWVCDACSAGIDMTDGHDVEVIGFVAGQKVTYDPLPGDPDAIVYVALHQRFGKLTLSAFHYYLQRSACTDDGVPYACCTGLRTGSCIAYNNHVAGTTAVGTAGDGWIGVRLHVHNSATAGEDWYKFYVDWDNDGTFDLVGNTDVANGGGYYTASGGSPSWSTAPITFSHPLRYIHIGQNDLEGSVDFQITGIKVNTSGPIPDCNRTGGGNNELDNVDPTPVTNNSEVVNEVTQTLFDHDAGAPNYILMDVDGLMVGTRFQSSVVGTITKICFYKDAAMTGLHTGYIYSSTGIDRVKKDFVGETDSGWQCAPLGANAYNILANETFTVAVYMPVKYIRTPSYFGSPRGNSGALTAQADNSWWSESTLIRPLYPSTVSGSRSNYWVDIEFEPAGAGGPWEMAVTNASAAGAKCTIRTEESPINDSYSGAVWVTVAPGWKASFTGTCGPGATLVRDNVYSFTTERMYADCGVTVTCSEKQVPLWIAP